MQLPPVCKDHEGRKVSPRYFFESNLWKNGNFTTHHFVQNHRQGNGVFFHALNKLRVATTTKQKNAVSSVLNHICNASEDKDAIYLVPRISDARTINMEHLDALDGEVRNLTVVDGECTHELFLKVGAKVIFTRNRYELGYYNGLTGVVEAISDGGQIVKVRTSDGKCVKAHRGMDGYDLALAYAITIHKSQGMTLEKANITPSCFAEGQLYTALSRVRSASGVCLLAPIRPEYIKVNENALSFDTAMRSA